MKRILILSLLLLVFLTSFVSAKEIRGNIYLNRGQAVRFEDKQILPYNENNDYDIAIATWEGGKLYVGDDVQVGLTTKTDNVQVGKLFFMGRDSLDSYKDCNIVNTVGLVRALALDWDVYLSDKGVKAFDKVSNDAGMLTEGDVYCLLSYNGKYYVKIKINDIMAIGISDEAGDSVFCKSDFDCSVTFDYVYQDDNTPYFGDKASQGNKVSQPYEPVSIEPYVSVKAPNVITKRVTAGTINVQDGAIVFEISNEDPNHKLEGYLSCDIPSDVIVTGSMGAATGEQAQYIGQTFIVDPAPARESMSLRLSSQNEGSKNIRCSINYVLFKEGKGYITSNGQYSADKKYQQVTVIRDIQFMKLEEKAKTDVVTYWYFIAGIGVIVLLLIIFLVYKLGHVSRQVKR